MEHRARFQEWKKKKRHGDDDEDDGSGSSGSSGSEEDESGSEDESGEEGGPKGEGDAKAGEADKEVEGARVKFAKKAQIRELPPSDSEEEGEAAGGGGKGGGGGGDEGGLSRKQREELAKQKAKEEYMRRYQAGETVRGLRFRGFGGFEVGCRRRLIHPATWLLLTPPTHNPHRHAQTCMCRSKRRRTWRGWRRCARGGRRRPRSATRSCAVRLSFCDVDVVFGSWGSVGLGLACVILGG